MSRMQMLDEESSHSLVIQKTINGGFITEQTFKKLTIIELRRRKGIGVGDLEEPYKTDLETGIGMALKHLHHFPEKVFNLN